MQAIRASIIGEQQLAFENYDLPDQPAGSQVLIKTERSVVSAGTELANYTGLDSDTRVPGAWCCYPWRPGYGGVGRVLSVGPDVKGIAPGDRVYGIFLHSTHQLFDTSWQLLVRVPEDLDSTTAAMGRMCGVAITAYRRARNLSIGDTVVIIGLGMVGNLAGQFFRAAGQTVIGLDIAGHRRALAQEVGFNGTLDPSALTNDQLRDRLKELNNGQQPPVVVDAVGVSQLVETGVHVAALNGQVIMLGTPRGPYETNATNMLKEAHFRGIEIIGALEWTIPLLKRQSPGVSTEANTELIFKMLRDGALKVKPLLSHLIAPAKLNDAYQGLLHSKDSYLGVVLDWENNPPPTVG